MGSRKTGRVRFQAGFPTIAQEFSLLTTEECPPPPGFVVLLVPENQVREIVQYFMDEPPFGTVVLAQIYERGPKQILQRLSECEESWGMPGSTQAYTWEDLTTFGEPEIVYQPGVDPHENCHCC